VSTWTLTVEVPASDEEQAYLPMISALSQCGEAQHNEVAGRTQLLHRDACYGATNHPVAVVNDPASRLHRFDSGRRL
jgi:hypothetical protein